MDAHDKPPSLSTLRDLGREINRSYRQLLRDAKAGRIKVIRLGNSLRVPAKERERILQRGF
jgi:hypothetical protein